MRKWLIAGSTTLAILFVLALGVTFLFDANQFRPKLEREMSRALGRTVAIGNIRLSILSGGISLEDVSIGDDPAFGTSPFVTAKAVTVGVELMPLVVSKELRVRSFTLDKPQVALRRSTAGTWNFSSVGATSTREADASSGSSFPAGLSVRKLTIAKGQVAVGAAGSTPRLRHVYQDVTLTASDVSYASPFPFRVRATTPGGGTIDLTGKAGPLNPDDLAATPLQVAVAVTRLDLAAAGFLDPDSGIAGLVDLTGRLQSDGRQARSTGRLRASRLQLVRGSSPARTPIEVEFDSHYDLKSHSGLIRQGDVHVGKAIARLTGSYSNRAESTAVRMKLAGRQMAVTELEALLPAIGAGLPAGASLRGGTLDLDLAISGPLDRLVTAGPIDAANLTLARFDLGSKMAAIATLAGVPKNGDTVIQTLHCTLRIAPDGLRADDVQLVAPAIGSLAGGGTIAPNGTLNFRMVAKLTGSNAALSSVSRLTSFGRPENGIPFKIVGTTANPVFVPDVAGVIRNAVTTPDAANGSGGFLGGLLGRFKRAR